MLPGGRAAGATTASGPGGLPMSLTSVSVSGTGMPIQCDCKYFVNPRGRLACSACAQERTRLKVKRAPPHWSYSVSVASAPVGILNVAFWGRLHCLYSLMVCGYAVSYAHARQR
jgi:hypothetical protein